VNTKLFFTMIMAALIGTLSQGSVLHGTEVDSGSASWPDFHGPGPTNISHEKGLLKKWPEDGPPLVWKYSSCGKGYSGVTIAGGMIFSAGDFISGVIRIFTPTIFALVSRPRLVAWRWVHTRSPAPAAE